MAPPPAAARCALLLVAVAVLVVLVAGAVGTYIWALGHWFVGVDGTGDGEQVAVFRGLDVSIVGFDFFELDEDTGLAVADLTPAARSRVRGGITADDAAGRRPDPRRAARPAAAARAATTAADARRRAPAPRRAAGRRPRTRPPRPRPPSPRPRRATSAADDVGPDDGLVVRAGGELPGGRLMAGPDHRPAAARSPRHRACPPGAAPRRCCSASPS